MNAVSTCKRLMPSIKKKFVQLKSTTKGLASGILREKGVTGGGETELPNLDELMCHLVDLDLWPRSLVKLVGVDGLLGIEGGPDGPVTGPEVINTSTAPASPNMVTISLVLLCFKKC